MGRYFSASILSLALFYLETRELKQCSEPNLDWTCEMGNLIFINRLWLALCVIFSFLIYNYFLTYRENNQLKNNIYDFVFQFFENNLGRDKESNRITLFKKKYGYQFFFKYLYHNIIRHRYYNERNKLWLRYRKTPLPWSQYLVVYSRCGMPNENFKSSCFKVSTDDQAIDSFLVYCYHTGLVESRVLPNICDLNFDNISKFEEIPRNRRKEVQTYMDLSKVKSMNSLKLFGRRTPHIAAIPLFTKKKAMNYPSHILMYDSLSKSFDDIEIQLKELCEYIEIILKNN